MAEFLTTTGVSYTALTEIIQERLRSEIVI